MSDLQKQAGLSEDELEAQAATAVPDKEVVSILDLNADIDLAIDAAAPIDLAVAANANVAAPIDAAVGANVLSTGSTAQALSDQGALITQGINADATAHATQDSAIDQGNDVVETGAGSTGTAPAATGSPAPDTAASPTGGTTADGTDGAGSADGDAAGAVGSTVGSATDAASGALDGDLLNVDVNVDADADLAAPINGAVAANANVAAPIDAAVAANIGSDNSEAVAVSQQDAIINQSIEGSAEASSDQQSDIEQ
jgi:hypothetical protein